MGSDRYCICYCSGTCLLVYEEETHVSSGTAYQPDQPFPYGEYPNRLSPHFTFNVLNREISRFRDGETLCGDLTELVKLLRKSLELTEKLSISLYDELEFVKTYIHLEQGRLGSDFSMDVKIEEDLDIQQVVIPSMVVQIPVEKCIETWIGRN